MKAKNFEEAMLPLHRVQLFFGCAVVKDVKNRQKFLLNICYIVIKWISYFVAFYFVVRFCTEAPWFRFEEEIFFAVIYTQACLLCFNVIYQWALRKDYTKMIELANHVDETLQSIGVEIDHQAMYAEQISLTIVWFAIAVIINSVDLLWLYGKVHVIRNYLIVSILQHPIHVNFLLDLTFSSAILHIKLRLRKINAALEELVNKNCQDNFFRKTPNTPLTICSKFRVKSRVIHETFMKTHCTNVNLQILKHVHLELGNIAKTITELSGVRVALGTIGTFLLLTGLLYITYLRVWSFSVDKNMAILVMWILQHGYRLWTLNYICSSTVTEFHQTREIIHDLEIVTKDHEIQNEIRQFSMQILQSSLCFQPCGLFTLGFDLIRSVANSVLTVVVILIQMSTTSG